MLLSIQQRYGYHNHELKYLKEPFSADCKLYIRNVGKSQNRMLRSNQTISSHLDVLKARLYPLIKNNNPM